ncbi:hypothetical protein K2X33_07175 [bacterium]|nr:hypothetical protein [bacterium]
MNPGRTPQKTYPAHRVTHQNPSHLERKITRDNLTNAHNRALGVRYSMASNQRLANWQRSYDGNHNANSYLRNRYNVCGSFYASDAYRFHYSNWFQHGFCGGYYYPVRPAYNISAYFYYPIANWMYAPDVDVDYYRQWYGGEYDNCPVTAFQYARGFYPTEQIRDLGTDMSALNATLQCGFRTAMTNMTAQIVQLVSDQIGEAYQLQDSDIVVNHYENLGNAAVEMEGFVNQDNINLPFKAVLDLVTPANTYVFVPQGDVPTPPDLIQLGKVNDAIKAAGGDPMSVDDEPTN